MVIPEYVRRRAAEPGFLLAMTVVHWSPPQRVIRFGKHQHCNWDERVRRAGGPFDQRCLRGANDHPWSAQLIDPTGRSLNMIRARGPTRLEAMERLWCRVAWLIIEETI